MKKIALAVAMSSTLLLSGCVIHVGHDGEGDSGESWQVQQKENKRFIAQLDMGTPINSVRDSLGTPDYVEAFEVNGTTMNVLFYRTHHKDSDGETSKDETTPLVFENGKLKGIGFSAYHLIREG